jgi:hypothetical protein
MRDGKEVAPREIRENRQKTGTGFASTSAADRTSMRPFRAAAGSAKDGAHAI